MVRRLVTCGVFSLLCGPSVSQAQPAELPLGSAMPLQDHAIQLVGGAESTFSGLAGSGGTILVFWSNNCRWSESYEKRILNVGAAAQESGIAVILVNANDPDVFPQEAASVGAAKKYPLKYVQDSGALMAQALGAFRTPHVFAFDASKRLVYSGAIDDTPGDPKSVKEFYLSDVIAQMAQGRSPDIASTRAFGCRIKFPSG